MKVSELGEFGLIELLAKMVTQGEDLRVSPWRQLLIGIGDDTAAFKGDGSTQLVTTDCLIQDVHFSLDTASFKAVGWKAMAANLSDIAAMGGEARYALVCLALPKDTEVDSVSDLYSGMIELAQQHQVAIIGGDTSSAPVVMISITITGSAPTQGVLTRSAAKVGDQVAVTGFLGTAAAGLEMLKKKLKFDAKIKLALADAFLYPQPRLIEGRLLLRCGVKAAIDISDGLTSDLRHILKASRVSARIEVERIPVHPAVRASFYNRALELALSGGEDYELLFTGSSQAIKKIRAEAACAITVIGEIVSGEAGEASLIDTGGRPYVPGKTGWEHFATG